MGRDKRILQSILSDSRRFIRYLFFILAQDKGHVAGTLKEIGGGSRVGDPGILLPLFEEMVRAYSREPEKIQRIDRLISDLRESGDPKGIIPSEFGEIWASFSSVTDKKTKP